ncbi:MAG: hypothetical protein ACKVOO_04305 [Burkholderiaceae bacterium]
MKPLYRLVVCCAGLLLSLALGPLPALATSYQIQGVPPPSAVQPPKNEPIAPPQDQKPRKYYRSADPQPLVCGFAEQPCRGKYTQRCYKPSAGQSCQQGQVCEFGTQACVGQYGQGCFRPSLGQQCNQGLVCDSGQRLCVGSGGAVCYSPSSGEQCF